MFRRLVETRPHWLPTVMRLLLGIVFFAHGAQKMLGWFGGGGYGATIGYFGSLGIPAPLAFLAIAAEFFGGIGLILGFLGRVAAFGVGVNMVVAALLLHVRNGLFMNWTGTKAGEGFEFHLLAVATAFGVMVLGSGALSVDRLLSRPRRETGVEEPVPHPRAA